jgi:anti-sigma regulatory factor (Ser/Thr protein kinase)
MHQEIELPRGGQAPGLARRALEAWCGDLLGDDELHAGKLVASELVTNAVLHGVGQIRFAADVDDDRLLIDVIDCGSGFEREVREVPFDELRGRGLAIVEAASSRWGIHEGTTHVWAELERAGPRVGAEKKPEA